MSYTEIVCFKKDGFAEGFSDIKNAWRGAMAIWSILEERYLPPFRPSYVPSNIPDDMVESWCRYKPSRNATCKVEDMQEIWNLYNKDNVSRVDKIVLGSTFDRVLIKKENFQEVIDAFITFEGETSLKEQAKVLEEMLLDQEIIAVGWNQTSVTENQWTMATYDENDEESDSYNCLTGENHFWLFDDLDGVNTSDESEADKNEALDVN